MTQLLPLRHLQSLLCQKPHVISHRHLTEGTGSLRGRTYSSEVYVELFQLHATGRLHHLAAPPAADETQTSG